MNLTSFSEQDFVVHLTRHLAGVIDTPEATCVGFLEFCEPIIFGDYSLLAGVTRLPHPYCELMAVYQAWGLVSSDGLESYFDSTDKEFDRLVDKGLLLLNQRRICRVLGGARWSLVAFGFFSGMIPERIKRHFWKRFYTPLKDFERDILGPYLVQVILQTEQVVAPDG